MNEITTNTLNLSLKLNGRHQKYMTFTYKYFIKNLYHLRLYNITELA